MGEFVNRIRFLAAGQDDPQSVALSECAARIELLEKGLCDILIFDDPMLMRMIAKACLTGAIDDEGKYCFVPPVALEGANGKP
jgi:hypothetical protein